MEDREAINSMRILWSHLAPHMMRGNDEVAGAEVQSIIADCWVSQNDENYAFFQSTLKRSLGHTNWGEILTEAFPDEYYTLKGVTTHGID